MSLAELQANAKVAIYGTGKRGLDYYKIIKACRPDVEIVCYLDSFKDDCTACPQVLKASNVNNSNLHIDIILICSEYYSEIMAHLQELKLTPHEHISTYVADWFVDLLSAEGSRKCEELFKELLNKLPHESFVYDALGRLESQRNNFKMATFYYEQAQGRFPNDIMGYLGYAKALADMNRYDLAEESYKSVVARFPDNPGGYLGRATACLEMHQFDAAEEIFKTVIARFPENPAGYLGCAKVYLELSRFEAAEEIYRSVIARFPNTPAGYLGCATIYLTMKRFEASEEIYRSMIVRFPDDPAGYLGCANVLQETNRYVEAKDIYEAYIAKCQDTISGYLEYAGLLREMNQYQESENIYKSIIEKFPGTISAYSEYAILLLERNRDDEVEKFCKAEVHRFPDKPDLYLRQAEALLNMARFVESKELYKYVIARFPYVLSGYLGLAAVLSQENKTEEAVEVLSSAKEVFPDNARVLFELKRVYIRCDEYSKARDILNIIRRSDEGKDQKVPCNRKKITFIHIPKCGGTTTTQYLKKFYDITKVYQQDSMCLAGNSDTYYSFLQDEERRYYDLILGYDPVVLPALASEALKVTVLRDPVDRALSSYYYSLRLGWISSSVKIEKFIEDLFVPGNIKNAPFSGYWYNAYIHTRPYVQHFSTDEDRIQFSGNDLVEKCCSCIDKFDLVGIIERMDDFFEELQKMGGFPCRCSGSKKNATVVRKKKNEISPSVVSFIKSHLDLDMRIYTFVKEKWDKKVSGCGAR